MALALESFEVDAHLSKVSLHFQGKDQYHCCRITFNITQVFHLISSRKNKVNKDAVNTGRHPMEANRDIKLIFPASLKISSRFYMSIGDRSSKEHFKKVRN
jgi:hypothetical protein